MPSVPRGEAHKKPGEPRQHPRGTSGPERQAEDGGGRRFCRARNAAVRPKGKIVDHEPLRRGSAGLKPPDDRGTARHKRGPHALSRSFSLSFFSLYFPHFFNVLWCVRSSSLPGRSGPTRPTRMGGAREIVQWRRQSKTGLPANPKEWRAALNAMLKPARRRAHPEAHACLPIRK
jgi:hypothetical protein